VAIIIAVMILTALNISYQLNNNYLSTTIHKVIQSDNDDGDGGTIAIVGTNIITSESAMTESPPAPPLLLHSLTPASDIVHKTYNHTFAHFHCPKQHGFKTCLQNMYEKIQSKEHIDNDDDDNDNGDKNDNGWPLSPSRSQHWWFQSLIRDAGNFGGNSYSGIFGSWHVGQAINPNVSMCMIEKIGITQWTKLFTSLNGYAFNTRKIRSDLKGAIDLPAAGIGYPSFVILRDPLERFLSAYLDKCVNSKLRREQQHCEPNLIYRDHNHDNIKVNPMTAGFVFGGDDDKLNRVRSRATHLKGHGKTAFAMYVDTMPLAWNLHFYPQSFYCNGLYRFIDDYDFVGHMDSGFYHDLDKLGKTYGGRFETKLKDIFKYESITEDNNNVGIETKASDKVIQYYTPRSLRRVLEYVSMDYVLLDLKVPDWAEQMLREDDERDGIFL